jgi:hypothetical protein
MKSFGKIAAAVAGGLALNLSAHAEDLALNDNPYVPIVTRNVFNLNPVIANPESSQPTPAIKITANGIMSIFGRLQVLFKTSGGAAGSKEQSYILSEGQRQDDITVLKISESAGIVKFDNHGIVQDLALTKAPSGGGSPSGSPVATSMFPGSSIAGAAANANSGNALPGRGRFGARGNAGNLGNTGNAAPNSDATDAMNLRNVPTRNGIYQPEASTMAPEEQAILREAQRAVYQAQGNPLSKLIPPTAGLSPDENNQIPADSNP